jgi:hypothetical protein
MEFKGSNEFEFSEIAVIEEEFEDISVNRQDI